MKQLSNQSNSDLRQILRRCRRELPQSQQIENSQRAAQVFLRSPWAQRPKRIALFFAQDGELDTEFLIQQLWRRGHQVYLPVITKSGLMRFGRYQSDTPLKANQFGILEPVVKPGAWLQANALDLVLMPLVGFDLQGHRLGMGGGFYDKTFAFKRFSSRKPVLIGWAHQCQQVESLSAQVWDVPMDAVITELGVVRFKNTILRD